MDILSFIAKHGLDSAAIDGPGCVETLLRQMDLGLGGRGNIPMIPAWLDLPEALPRGKQCCVMDAGGTNLRVARGAFDEAGACRFHGLRRTHMPGTREILSAEEFYRILGDFARETGCPERIGLCFSYNVALERDLDGVLLSWCKEVRVSDAPGKKVGASLLRVLDGRGREVRVLNDSTAALLGAYAADPGIRLGLILGTGINVCYREKCENIPKLPGDFSGKHMIISTEIGEFDGIPKSTFDAAVIASSAEPDLAHAEKQCAGAYLGDLISLAWKAAAEEKLIAHDFAADASLPEISDYLAGSREHFPEDPGALDIARAMVRRAAKIAAILTAGPLIRACPPGQCCGIAIEGSQYEKLTHFGPWFRQELEALLRPRGIGFRIFQGENSCLLGAALAAFAEPM